VNNVEWGYAPETATVMPPGSTAGDGRCEAGEWGIPVDDVVVYATLAGLRVWATSILDKLPPERHATPLVTVDPALQDQWLTWSAVLTRIKPSEQEPADQVRFLQDLMKAVAADPSAAGWTLGDDVAALWVDLDDDGDVIAGVRLSSSGYEVGIGEPLSEQDLSISRSIDLVERANAYLHLLAERINAAY
jgi:hypothetical protein